MPFEKLSILACEDITVRELINLQQTGHSVYRSSHAGNWSLYKLLMSELGIPDCIWDATCVYRDINNQPGYQLLAGQKLSLLGKDFKQPSINSKTRFLTAYHQLADQKMTLGHFHLAPLKQLFGDVVTTQSEVLLEYLGYLRTVFDIVQNYLPEQLGRYVLPCGCMVMLQGGRDSYYASCDHNSVKIERQNLAESAINTIKELQLLLCCPGYHQAKGGVLYSLELAVASFYLWSYWKFGDKTIYTLSGPDMIKYATKRDFISKVERVLKLITKHAPVSIMPQRVEVKIVPATLFRFGYPDNCTKAKMVMAAHETFRQVQSIKRNFKDLPELTDSLNLSLKGVIDIVERNENHWNLFHDVAIDAFYSQHDMLASGARMIIQEAFLDVPFAKMRDILLALSQSQGNLKKQLLHSYA